MHKQATESPFGRLPARQLPEHIWSTGKRLQRSNMATSFKFRQTVTEIVADPVYTDIDGKDISLKSAEVDQSVNDSAGLCSTARGMISVLECM